jgi:hypothetical protein
MCGILLPLLVGDRDRVSVRDALGIGIGLVLGIELGLVTK